MTEKVVADETIMWLLYRCYIQKNPQKNVYRPEKRMSWNPMIFHKESFQLATNWPVKEYSENPHLKPTSHKLKKIIEGKNAKEFQRIRRRNPYNLLSIKPLESRKHWSYIRVAYLAWINIE